MGRGLIEDRSVLNEHLVPRRHYIQIQPKKKKKNGNDESWEIACAGADVYLTHKPALVTIRASKDATPLVAWVKGQETKATVCEISEYLRATGGTDSLMESNRGRRHRLLLYSECPFHRR